MFPSSSSLLPRQLSAAASLLSVCKLCHLFRRRASWFLFPLRSSPSHPALPPGFTCQEPEGALRVPWPPALLPSAIQTACCCRTGLPKLVSKIAPWPLLCLGIPSTCPPSNALLRVTVVMVAAMTSTRTEHLLCFEPGANPVRTVSLILTRAEPSTCYQSHRTSMKTEDPWVLMTKQRFKSKFNSMLCVLVHVAFKKLTWISSSVLMCTDPSDLTLSPTAL